MPFNKQAREARVERQFFFQSRMKMSGIEDPESQVIVKNRRIEKPEKPNFHPDVVGNYLQEHRPGVNTICYQYILNWSKQYYSGSF